MDAALFAVVGTAVASFMATNVDDLALLAGWFSDRTYETRHIAIGQLLGIGALTAASVLLSFLGLLAPAPALGALGLLPIGIGILRLMRRRGRRDDGAASAAGSVAAVAGVTAAQGGDNLAVYVPLFATQRALDKGITAAVFLLMTILWLAAAIWFVRHRAWGPTIQRWGRRLVPWVLIVLGGRIVYEAGTIDWLQGLHRLK